MSKPAQAQWERFKKHYSHFDALGLAIDLSRVDFPDDYFQSMKRPISQAFVAMAALEAGAIANPDENRMVGHYWLRTPKLAPDRKIQREIPRTLSRIKSFADAVHTGKIKGARGRFEHLLVIGIGGSALGPQFVAKALGRPGADRLVPHFFDNTDPDGMDQVLAGLGGQLGRTLCLVISKSGGTPETRNGMLEAKAAYAKVRLSFEAHAVAITMDGSQLDQQAIADHWLARFPMWDWVGGRTSVTSAVGLLPAALQGLDIDALLAGAKACDAVTRTPDATKNPAAQLALMWHFIGRGKGEKDMVVLPYKDRLELFSRYLQQLVMESLGKEKNLRGDIVHQGLAVYGNKGSTDQHAYIQQLRDGLNNFFVVFLEVLHDRQGLSIPVGPKATAGDYLFGFFLGTRNALHANGRPSLTLTIDQVSPFSVGVLIALFERAVGLYASLIGINAYHQPGVQAGKVAADAVLALQVKVLDYLSGYAAGKKGSPLTAQQIAAAVGTPEVETIFKICEHLAATRNVLTRKSRGPHPGATTYRTQR
jgi:glucose-6-phosphate isomerase